MPLAGLALPLMLAFGSGPLRPTLASAYRPMDLTAIFVDKSSLSLQADKPSRQREIIDPVAGFPILRWPNWRTTPRWVGFCGAMKGTDLRFGLFAHLEFGG